MASRKEECVSRLEEWILSGDLQVGQRLPPERVLAAEWSISRPVLHEAIVDIQGKGLVRIVPRHGVYVNDFRTSGSVPMLSSLIAYSGNSDTPAFVQSLFELRMMLECETARLAALHRTDAQVQSLYALADAFIPSAPPENLIPLVFTFNHMIALASQNLIYPLIINSFKDVYYKFSSFFLQHYHDPQTIAWIRSAYRGITAAIEDHDSEKAGQRMQVLISTGEAMYKRNLSIDPRGPF